MARSIWTGTISFGLVSVERTKRSGSKGKKKSAARRKKTAA